MTKENDKNMNDENETQNNPPTPEPTAAEVEKLAELVRRQVSIDYFTSLNIARFILTLRATDQVTIADLTARLKQIDSYLLTTKSIRDEMRDQLTIARADIKRKDEAIKRANHCFNLIAKELDGRHSKRFRLCFNTAKMGIEALATAQQVEGVNLHHAPAEEARLAEAEKGLKEGIDLMQEFINENKTLRAQLDGLVTALTQIRDSHCNTSKIWVAAKAALSTIKPEVQP